MAQINIFWQQVTSLVFSLFSSLTWRNLLDIAIVAFVIYQVMKMVRQTRANSVLKGVGVVIVATWLSEALQLSAISWVLQQVISMGFIVLVVLFQPELRRALETIGRSGLFFSLHRQRDAERDTRELVQAMANLSRRRVGALIVMERKTGLKDIVASGTTLDAEISAALIENIFEPNTPLHDGAVIINGGRIVAAACFLPLSENSSISRELGTRHRAALGISESTDAVVLIASEETGILSMAREGKLTRYLDERSLTAILTEFFKPDAQQLQTTWRNAIKRKERRSEE